MEWATAGGGKLVQWKDGGSSGSYTSTTSASFVDTGASFTYTPTSASNRVFVIYNQWFRPVGDGTSNNLTSFWAGNINHSGISETQIWGTGNNSELLKISLSNEKADVGTFHSFFNIHHPNTTNECTYTTQYRKADDTTSLQCNVCYAQFFEIEGSGQ